MSRSNVTGRSAPEATGENVTKANKPNNRMGPIRGDGRVGVGEEIVTGIIGRLKAPSRDSLVTRELAPGAADGTPSGP